MAGLLAMLFPGLWWGVLEARVMRLRCECAREMSPKSVMLQRAEWRGRYTCRGV